MRRVERTVLAQVVFDVSGAPGRAGVDGLAGPDATDVFSVGGRGTPGSRGTQGSKAGNLNVSLAVEGDRVVVRTAEGAAQNLRLGSPQASIILRAVGGAGGKGGAGGAGGEGYRGQSGSDALAAGYRQAGDGSSGSDGGDGADGASGGAGGDGGMIYVAVQPDDADVLGMIESAFQGGPGGPAGEGGAGGPGGNGGEGGKGDSYTHYQAGSGYYTIKYSQGFSGKDGATGRAGNSGSSGANGKDGSLTLAVGPNVYSSVYNLSLATAKVVAIDGAELPFLEPGSRGTVQVSVKNSGGMPSPQRHVAVGVIAGAWVDGAPPSVDLGRSLRPGAVEAAPALVPFQVAEREPAEGEPLDVQHRFQVSLFLTRFAKGLSCIETEPVRIRHAASLQPVSAPASFSREGAVKVMMALRNSALSSIGKSGDLRRRVFVTLGVPMTSEVPNDAVRLSMSSFEADMIPSRTDMQLEATLALADSRIPPYAKVHLVAELFLAPPNGGEPRLIQRRPFSLQLMDTYRPDRSADVLFVTSPGTISSQVFAAWRRFVGELGLRLSVWNTDGGPIDFLTRSSEAEGPTLQDLAGKVVILRTATKDLIRGQLFRLAKDHRVRFYIPGGGRDRQDVYLPSTDALVAGDEIRITQARFTISEYQKKAGEQLDDRRREKPRERYYVDMEKVAFTRWAHMVEAPPATEASILSVETAQQDPSWVSSKANRYGLVKVLPFDRKLDLFARLRGEALETVRQAIVSDLADEQVAFLIEGNTGSYTQAKIENDLHFLKALLARTWEGSLRDEVRWILLRIRATSKLSTGIMDMLPNRRPRLLSAATCKLIDEGLRRVLGLERSGWKVVYEREHVADLKAQDQHARWNQLRNPCNLRMYQSNWKPGWEDV